MLDANERLLPSRHAKRTVQAGERRLHHNFDGVAGEHVRYAESAPIPDAPPSQVAVVHAERWRQLEGELHEGATPREDIERQRASIGDAPRRPRGDREVLRIPHERTRGNQAEHIGGRLCTEAVGHEEVQRRYTIQGNEGSRTVAADRCEGRTKACHGGHVAPESERAGTRHHRTSNPMEGSRGSPFAAVDV
jgi:hypothetical protein